MTLFAVKINEQKGMFQDIFKYSILLIIFHILTYLSGVKNFGIINGILFNENFLMLLLLIIITIIAYYLVVCEIIKII